MNYGERRRRFGLLCWSCLCVLVLLSSSVQAAERPPYEFDATLSLTGGCGTSKADPIPDPGCPEGKPPKPFTKTTAIAIDPIGDEYVASYGKEEGKDGRIDIFSSKGVFIAEVKDEFGPKDIAVDSKGVLYIFDQSPGHPAEFARYKPTTYKAEEERIEYGPREVIVTELGPHEGGLAIDNNDHVLVDWSVSIKEYSSAEEENKLLETITSKRLFSSTFIALDKQRRRLYASSCPDADITKCWVLVFSADKPHELLKEIKGPNPAEEGFLSQKGWISIAVNEESGDFFVGDLEQTKNVYQFNEKSEHVSTLALNPELFEGGEPLQITASNAKTAFNHEDLFVPSAAPKNRALAFHPPAEFEPEIVSVSAAGISEDEAELQATIKPDGGKTTYRFEYLSQKEYEEAGETFAGVKLAGEGTILTTEQEAEVKAPISGLSPETQYHFLVRAENEAGPGEPRESSFTTYSDASISQACPNETLRIAHSVPLPDCRAYELVTPADTGGQLPSGASFAGDTFPAIKTSPDGDVVSFLTHGGSLPGFEGTGSLNGDLYRTARTEHGWSTEGAGPNGSETTSANQGSTSPDQGYSFWQATGEGSAVIGGERTGYVRYPDGHSELIGRGSFGTDPRARGKLITENGAHIIFTSTGVIYDRTANEETHIVSQLPDNPEVAVGGEYLGASADGEGIGFIHAGTLYLRAGNATTYEIGTGVEFAGVSEGARRIFFVEGGDLIAFDTETERDIPFTEVGNAVPVNVSADGTRAYFASTTAIAGSGENPNGEEAQEGKDKENLYLSEEGTIRFVAIVTERDVVGEAVVGSGQVDGLGLWIAAGSRPSALDPSRASPAGSVLLFSSRANLNGYAHEGTPEIYRYDSAGNRLSCISCIPTKGSATNGASLQSLLAVNGTLPPLNTSGLVSNLRADGERVFFQSTEALVSSDNNGLQDVYEWEEQRQGSCTRVGGCVYLISSGHSAKDSFLYGASANGDNVFFTTTDVLANGDDDTLSIYDARVNGGFFEMAEERCHGEGCKPGLSPPPPIAKSESGARPESGNAPKHCSKGKHKVTRHGEEVCVKNKKHHKKHHAKKKGRVGK